MTEEKTEQKHACTLLSGCPRFADIPAAKAIPGLAGAGYEEERTINYTKKMEGRIGATDVINDHRPGGHSEGTGVILQAQIQKHILGKWSKCKSWTSWRHFEGVFQVIHESLGRLFISCYENQEGQSPARETKSL